MPHRTDKAGGGLIQVATGSKIFVPFVKMRSLAVLFLSGSLL